MEMGLESIFEDNSQFTDYPDACEDDCHDCDYNCEECDGQDEEPEEPE